jgi:LacI family transcriptional regulator
MPRQVTLADIARKSKCSVSTVSLVLRGRPGIASETRERVLTAAQTLRYRARSGPAKQTPARQAGRLRNVGVILKADAGQNPASNAFYAQVLAGIEAACRSSKLNLLYATLPVDENNAPLEMPRLLSETLADGFLLLGARVDARLVRLFSDSGRPVVLVDAYADGGRYDSVVSDNIYGAFQGTNALIERGHRHIGLVGGHSTGYPSLRERREGYLLALRAHGLRADYHACCAPNDEAAKLAATTLLRDHPEITALIGVNDAVAIASMWAAQALGRGVPKDLSIIGFDDIDLARHVTPTLSTMHVDKAAMGRLAMLLLGYRFEAPDAERDTVILRARLIERESVAGPGTGSV